MATRVLDNVTRPPPITLLVNGRAVMAYEGETVAAVLLTAGITYFRRTHSGQPRAPFCNMGTCFDCLVLVGGDRALALSSPPPPWVRACMTLVTPGMSIETLPVHPENGLSAP